MTDQATTRPLATKIASILGKLGRVAKSGRNAFHNYDYATESDIVDALRQHLAAEGVCIFPSVVDSKVETVQDRNKSATLATVTLELTFVDGASGDTMVTRWIGQGIDQGDKAYYKAYTGAFKYGLMKTFMVSTGEEPEQDEPVIEVDNNWASANRRLRGSVAQVLPDKDDQAAFFAAIKKDRHVESAKDLTAAQLNEIAGMCEQPGWAKKVIG
jgi:hypothetical protein